MQNTSYLGFIRGRITRKRRITSRHRHRDHCLGPGTRTQCGRQGFVLWKDDLGLNLSLVGGSKNRSPVPLVTVDSLVSVQLHVAHDLRPPQSPCLIRGDFDASSRVP